MRGHQLELHDLSCLYRELKVATGIIKILITKNEPFMCHLLFIKIINGLQKILGLTNSSFSLIRLTYLFLTVV